MRDAGCGRVRLSWTTSRVPREDDDSEAGPFLHDPFPRPLRSVCSGVRAFSIMRPDSHSCPEPRLSFSPDFSSHSHSESTTSRRLRLHHDGCHGQPGIPTVPPYPHSQTSPPKQTVYAPVPSHYVRSGQSRGTVEMSRAELMGLTQRKRMAGRTSMSVHHPVLRFGPCLPSNSDVLALLLIPIPHQASSCICYPIHIFFLY